MNKETLDFCSPPPKNYKISSAFSYNFKSAWTLFALEDIRGRIIGEIDGEICLRLDKSRGTMYHAMFEMLSAWADQARKLETGEITREDYDRWRYNYPKYDTAQRWAKVPSQELSDFLTDALKNSADTDE